MKRVLTVALLALLSIPALAGVTVPSLFSDNMVLQRDRPVRVWGWATPGEEVRVDVAGQKWLALADADGTWKVMIDAMPAGGPHTLVVRGTNTLTFENVMYGDVYVCSGQSNMQFTVREANDADEEIAEANYSNIRLFHVPQVPSESKSADVIASWDECSPESVAKFSAVAYYFGRSLNQETGVPIGLIHTSWGGTPVESWMSRQVLRTIPQTSALLDAHFDAVKEFGTVRNPPRSPGALYNGMIAPFTRFTIAGAIWYQGESNANDPGLYRFSFPAMIRDWRRAWGYDFPFYFVQLASFRGNAGWPGLREAQLMALNEPNTGMAVAIDIGETNDIHPKNKQDVGKRLARWALRDIYGLDVVVSGPLYKDHKIFETNVEVLFEFGGGMAPADGELILGFEIAGADRKFVPARAVVKGNTVVVSNPMVRVPVAVRYAWHSDPNCNLVNKAGLPASPFRTDDWD